MLSDLFIIHYRHPERTPVQLQIIGNRLVIDCCFHYNRRALLPDPASGRIPADVIEEGICQLWSGTYELDLAGLAGPVEVAAVISRDRSRRSVPVYIRRLLVMPSHVISPFYRRIWGVFKTGQLESMGANWSVRQPGAMILAADSEPWRLARVAAHEAGHIFGPGDAYGAIYRFYYAVPGTGHYMMHSNDRVQPAEILMLLRAHQSGRMQFFPRQWHGRTFIRGLRLDIRQRASQLRQQLHEWRQARRRPKS